MALADMPQSNKQHAVPQNIMEVEFKLIGDLTMRQFAYLILCGIFTYISLNTVVGFFKIPVAGFFAVLGLCLAFVPIEERGLDEWIINFIHAVYSPTQMVWKKEPVVPKALSYDNLAVVQQELITLAPTSSRRKLEEYLKYQDKAVVVDPLDIPELEYAKKVHDAFVNAAPVVTSVDVITEETPLAQFAMPAPMPEMPKLPEPTDKGGSQDKKVEPQKPAPSAAPKPVMIAPRPQHKPKKKEEAPLQLPQRRTSAVDLNPITPNMHAGRRFTNLLPTSGELVLPIRGERVLRSVEQLDVEEDIKEKAEKLQQLLKQIKTSEGVPAVVSKPTPVAAPIPEPVKQPEPSTSEAELTADQLKSQNEDLANQIAAIKEDIKKAKSLSQNTSTMEQMLIRLELQKKKSAEDYESLNRQILDLQNKLKEKEQPVASPTEFKEFAPVAKMQPLTNKPNVVSGVVKDSSGKSMENVLLIIKNTRGEPVRAFKSNTLGQFVLSTPLSPGLYTVEVSPVNNFKETFGIISIEVKGDILPPVELKGK